MVLEAGNNVRNQREKISLRQPMSSHIPSRIPIVIDPEAPRGLEQLANAAFLQATDVPEGVRTLIPSETLPISTLLEADIPNRLSKTSIIRPVHLCASPLDPHWTIDELFKTSLPPHPWLYVLEENLSTMWASGTRSIKPPSSSSPNLQFPLWVMNFWSTVVEVAEQRDKWKAAEDWLSRRVQDSEIRNARSLFGNVPWGLKLWSLACHDRETRASGTMQFTYLSLFSIFSQEKVEKSEKHLLIEVMSWVEKSWGPKRP